MFFLQASHSYTEYDVLRDMCEENGCQGCSRERRTMWKTSFLFVIFVLKKEEENNDDKYAAVTIMIIAISIMRVSIGSVISPLKETSFKENRLGRNRHGAALRQDTRCTVS